MDLGILLWNTCNARCAHCAVSSGPREKRIMSNDDIKRIMDGAFLDCASPSIGLSGGEAFYYFDDLIEVASYATRKGAKVAINTNCFWADEFEHALATVEKLKDIGISKLVASTDSFHRKYIAENCIINAVKACLTHNLEIEIQYVASRKSERLHSFLNRNQEELLNITIREIPCHPVGRAENMADQSIIASERIPQGTCPNAVLSVSADGRYIPCCNTAGHLPTLELGKIGEDQSAVFARFINSPVMKILWKHGPKHFLNDAVEAGYQHPSFGYIDQCHLCYSLFKDPGIAAAIKEVAHDEAFRELYRLFKLRLAQPKGNPTLTPFQ